MVFCSHFAMIYFVICFEFCWCFVYYSGELNLPWTVCQRGNTPLLTSPKQARIFEYYAKFMLTSGDFS